MPVTQEIIETARRSRSMIRNLINQIRTLRIRNNELEQQLEEAMQQIRRLEHLDRERCSGYNQRTGMRCKNFGKYQGYCHHHRRC